MFMYIEDRDSERTRTLLKFAQLVMHEDIRSVFKAGCCSTKRAYPDLHTLEIGNLVGKFFL